MHFFSVIIFVFIAVTAFGGIFVKERVAYALMLFGSVLWFAGLQGIFSEQIILYIAGAYLAIIIILRMIVRRFPQKETAINLGIANVLDKVFRFFTGRTLADRLLQIKKMGEEQK